MQQLDQQAEIPNAFSLSLMTIKSRSNVKEKKDRPVKMT